ncbi:MAG: helix-turn-helix transcriptional regulator [Bacteroidetes bacterium]|jgi:DNA-binding CsgD family transcriptional regulator|nr:helix-turn-helix transcriptional regulator [Bacteroidota bacterium]MBT4340219.1 helix-turn-helix transcriptional regulator [Bacteroidota bacterium]MBT5990841.1 helix-turn-helix transcriptional regulator [Bacteroidota bacterium]MBT6837958.1 helix-turn-helix transcriptional regulator [Bacteroidota bacterium]MBT7039963.1 helix-turn-helix transcriptional regulator [Bacteroidota bacterium]
MFSKIKSIIPIFCILFFVTITAGFSQKIQHKGYISGQLSIDTIWDAKLYLSYIENFNEMYSMSNESIIEETKIDSTGAFFFKLDFLSAEDNLYRIHVVKKGDPPASLIIGGSEENHFFVIANKQSQIKVQSSPNSGIFNDIVFEASPINSSFQYIDNMANYIDSMSLYGLSLKKEFISKAINEKYRSIADTSHHPLIALYAIYQSKFESNYPLYKDYYSKFTKKWKSDKSTYFIAFRNQMPSKSKYHTFLFVLLAIGCIVLGYLLSILKMSPNKKSKSLNNLSIQERKILVLIQQGLSNQEISDQCNIGMSTVKSHVSNIYGKLKIKSRKEALNIKTLEI